MGGWRALLAILALAGAVALPPAGCTKRLKKLAEKSKEFDKKKRRSKISSSRTRAIRRACSVGVWLRPCLYLNASHAGRAPPGS